MGYVAPHRPVMKLGVASTDWSRSVYDDRGWPVPGGANWVRFGQLVKPSKHHWVIAEPLYAGGRLGIRSWDQRTHFDVDGVILQRFMDGWMPGAISSARSHGQVVVNDVDDWFWGLHPRNQAYAMVDPRLNPLSNVNHYRRSLEGSNFVTVSTPFLAERMKEWGIPTIIIENGVSTERFMQRQHRHGTPIVGWTGSTGHRSGDLEIAGPALRALKRSVRFHHTGHYEHNPSFAAETGVDPRAVSTTPMLTHDEYPYGFEFDIGIAPLSNNDFNRAKSWIKVIEYMAAGVPWVGSDMPEYRRLYEMYGVGRLATSMDEWVAHLRELADPDVRAEESARQLEVVRTHLDVKQMASRWDSIVWGEVTPS